MNYNQKFQQSKLKKDRKAEISFVLGIISVLPTINLIMNFLGIHKGIMISVLDYIEKGGMLSFFGGWLLPIAGITLGILGLKYGKKKLAFAGIILSLAGLVGYLWIILILVKLV